MPSLLVVDDEEDTRELLAQLLRKRGYVVHAVGSGAECLQFVSDHEIDLVITDHQMPGMTGVDLVRELAIRHPEVTSIVLTGLAQLEIAVEAIRAGAFDFVTKPVRGDTLEIAVQRALEHQGMKREVKRLRSAVDEQAPISSIIGSSPAARAMIATIRRIAPSDATVLITGESGTGKELAARALHDLSDRHGEPFVAINCGAVPPNLLESELFGHVVGAFTDAKASRAGLFVQAKRGTIFLDEIGEMPLEMQVKLLRVLQERQVRPVGGDTEVPFYARVVTATNRDLETEVEEHRFREDLYYRINVVNVEVAPLRDRAADIVPIANAILEKIAARTKRARLTLSPEATRKLLDYNWPGNVRELENSLERAAAMTREGMIDPSTLPKAITSFEPSTLAFEGGTPDDMVTLDEMTVRYTKHVLDLARGNKTHAARILGIDRRSLYRRLEASYAKRDA